MIISHIKPNIYILNEREQESNNWNKSYDKSKTFTVYIQSRNKEINGDCSIMSKTLSDLNSKVKL